MPDMPALRNLSRQDGYYISKPAWATYQIPDEPELYSKTLSQETRQSPLQFYRSNVMCCNVTIKYLAQWLFLGLAWMTPWIPYLDSATTNPKQNKKLVKQILQNACKSYINMAFTFESSVHRNISSDWYCTMNAVICTYCPLTLLHSLLKLGWNVNSEKFHLNRLN